MYKKNSLKKTAAIKIATYNVLFSMNTKSIVKNIAALAGEGVIVFCLQEIVKTNDKKFIVDEILGSLGKNWLASYHLGNQNLIDSGTCIIWNRQFLKLEKIEKILLPKIKKLAIHELIFDKLTGQKGLPVQRKAISALFKFQGKNVLITNVHLDNVGGKSNRLKQLQYLLELLRRNNQFSYQIICGDFNSFDLLKTGVEKKRLEQVLGSDFSDAAESISWTADIYNMALAKKPSLFTEFIKILHLHVRRKLDYIWIKNFKLIECRKIIVPGSDHYPVVAKLMFSPTLDLMKDCLICSRVKLIKEGGNPYFVKELETGYVVLGDFQYYKGYTLFLSKIHAEELHQLETTTMKKFLVEMAQVASAVYNAFKPHKLNYELLGNGEPHLHWHIFPRYRSDPDLAAPVWIVDKSIRDAESARPSNKQLEEMKKQLLKYL